MKSKVHILVALVAGMSVLHTGNLYAEGPKTSEYRMKAAYIYNFIQFVQWPEAKKTDGEHEEIKKIRVGVTDKDLLTEFGAVIGNKEISRNDVVYRIVVEYVDVGQLQDRKDHLELDVLFIKSSTRYDAKKLPGATTENSILTFGETSEFLEAGGIVRFVIVKNKLKFEINVGAAERSGINIRSQLLKLAKKVVQNKEEDEKAES